MEASIIIVSYNTIDLLKNCLDSILESDFNKNKLEVIVVDNASVDGSSRLVSSKFPQVKLITNKTNKGFGAANNQGARFARGDYLLFLNSDTVLKPNTLSLWMKEVSKVQPDISSCRLLNSDGSIQPQGGALPSLGNLLLMMTFIDDLPLTPLLINPYHNRSLQYFKQNQRPGWVGGTAMMVKRSVYTLLQGFDEKIFMYAEDVDFCARAHHSNFSIHYFFKPQLTHLSHASGGAQKAIKGEIEGLKYYFKKHHSPWKLPLLRAILKLGCSLRIFLFGIIRTDESKANAYRQALRVV